MDDYTGQITIISSSTMVHQRARCMICDQPVDHRVVFLTNDARVLHTGCVPEHVRVPNAVLMQAIKRLERQVERARSGAVEDDAPDLYGSEDSEPSSPRDETPSPPPEPAG
jgi:hypothetical protein